MAWVAILNGLCSRHSTDSKDSLTLLPKHGGACTKDVTWIQAISQILGTI